MAVQRISTGIKGLDERMEGGIPEKYVTLICGRAGTMKSTLAYSILFNAAKSTGRRGIYVTLEQNRQSLVDHMVKIGMDPRQIKGEGGIIIVDMARLRKEMEKKQVEGEINWPQSVLTTVNNYKMKYGCNIFVLDSLAALYSITDIKNPRSEIFMFFDKLRGLQITTFLISEMLEPDKLYFGQYGVEDFLSDGIFHLEMERDARNVNLYLSVVKMRMTKHDRGYYPLIVEHGGLEIVTD
ncbi:MAG: RAD55 family ATPase [Thermoplasmata archaeon]